jgi:hypothetical protein
MHQKHPPAKMAVRVALLLALSSARALELISTNGTHTAAIQEITRIIEFYVR